MRAAVVVVVSLSWFGPSVAAADPPRLFWNVELLDAQSVSSGFVRYRAYPPCPELSLTLSLTNKGSATVAVVTDRFSRSIAVRVWQDNEPVEVDVEWDAMAIHTNGSEPLEWAASPAIQLQPESWLRWTARVRPTDGGVFPSAEYRLEIAAAAESLVSMAGGQPWTGAVNLARLPLIVIVEAPRSPQETAQAHWLAGSKALRESDDETAMREFRQALAANPADITPLAGVALLHYRRGNYAEAVKAYEEVIKVPGAMHGSVPLYLACSYVWLSDYANAARVLRSAGASEGDVAAQLAACREKQGPRRP